MKQKKLYSVFIFIAAIGLLLTIVSITPQTSFAETIKSERVAPKSVANGWECKGGYWYYYRNNVMQTGWQYISGWYYFNANGQMQTGWQCINSSVYYFLDSGKMAVGTQTISGKQYTFDGSTGKLTTSGWLLIGWYYVNTDGSVSKGWKYINGWFYFNTSGQMQTGWQCINSNMYYFLANGKMAVGTQTISGKQYTFDGSTGKLTTSGWLLVIGTM